MSDTESLAAVNCADPNQKTRDGSKAIKTPRDSNVELLRILATLLILLVHTNYFACGPITIDSISSNPGRSLWHICIQFIAIPCVNLFILISGWYGIRPKVKSIGKFIYQCLFYSILIYAICLLTGFAEFTAKGVAECFYLAKINWFIKAYLCLYIISPILNAFVELADRKLFEAVLVFFFLFEIIYGWSGAAVFLEQGYSATSFAGLYLLSRYMHIYKPRFSTLTAKQDIIIWVSGLLLFSAGLFCYGYLISEGFSLPRVLFEKHSIIFSYISPAVLFLSVYLFLPFTKIKVRSTVVNWFAKSSFAAFLIHANPNILYSLYVPMVLSIYATNNTIEAGAIILMSIFLIFIGAILVDQLRIASWDIFWRVIKPTK